MRALYSFEKDKLLHSGRVIIPLLLLISYIGIAYAIGPLEILSSFSLCALVLFVLSLSVGVMTAGLSYPMIEQAMLVKLPRKHLFFFSRVLLMAALALVFGLVAVLGPLLIHVCSGSALFKRPVALADVLSGLVLFWLVSYSGGMAGLFASPRLIRSRRTSLLMGAAFGVLTVVKGALVKKATFLAYILWVLPPVHDLTVAYSADSYFHIGVAWPYFLWMVLYAAFETVAYVWIMTKRRFE
jgi:hypothetical protein